MAEALLVMTERQIVSRLIEAFDEEKLDIRIILLAKFDEYSSTRLVLSSHVFDQDKALFNYKVFGDILRRFGAEFEDISLLLMKMNDPVVRALQEQFGAFDDTRGTYIGLQTLGNRYVENGYVYRVR